MTTWMDSLVGRSVRMTRTGGEVAIGARLGAGGQGVVHEAMLGSRPLAIKWLRHSSRVDSQRRAIEQLMTGGQPHPAFTWPIDTLEAPGAEGFGYLMPRVDKSRFQSFASMLNAKDQPSFRTLITISRELVDAFAALHGAGWCYRDINFGNLWVDVERAEVAIIDVDNIGKDQDEIFVRGTPRFMAPEIVRGDELPSTTTDLYSLSVFLFHMFVHGHPLDGARTDSSYNWSAGHISDTALNLLHYGIEPIFVFDPKNASNRPLPGDPMVIWWNLLPRFLQDVFVQAFTTGLWDTSLSGRVLETVWRRKLARLADCVALCPSCRATRFWDPDDGELPCWNCRQPMPRPPLLEVHSSRVVLSPGAAITSHHLRKDKNYRRPLGLVERHPDRPGDVVIRNFSDRAWKVRPDGEEPKLVEPNQRMAVRAMEIDFDCGGPLHPARGRIVPGEKAAG